MKIGILYICTGKYSVFWKNFHKTCERHFLSHAERHYFVFTDDLKIQSDDRIHVKYEKPKGFPMDSLLRFDMFLSVREQLIDMDYVFFFNSNMSFAKDVGEEVLPKNKNGLMALVHPGFFSKKPSAFPYERNKKSTAYIKYNPADTYTYYMGSFNGGKTASFLEMSETLSANIAADMENNIVAIYHDESHLNSYLHGKEVLGVDQSYGYPEDSNLGMEPKILILNKIKHGGKYFDKLPATSYLLRIRKKMERLYSQIIWKLQ